jgi:hypothetical protein
MKDALAILVGLLAVTLLLTVLARLCDDGARLRESGGPPSVGIVARDSSYSFDPGRALWLSGN